MLLVEVIKGKHPPTWRRGYAPTQIGDGNSIIFKGLSKKNLKAIPNMKFPRVLLRIQIESLLVSFLA